MRIRIDPDGDLLLAGLPLILADTLQRIPGLLASDDPRVRGRLLRLAGGYRHRRPDIGDDGHEPFQHHGVDQLVAAFEVVMHHGRRDACQLRDVGDGGRGHAARGEPLGGEVEQP